MCEPFPKLTKWTGYNIYRCNFYTTFWYDKYNNKDFLHNYILL